mmetsp:Transcript_436/g.647  ORF Transcript_436/g.647 Transcript_436/m.647 type:complete len:711 (-) Transcript_436:65-2197(-)
MATIKKVSIKSNYGVESFSDQEYNRPRRPNVDTIQYLSSLPLDLKVAEVELNEFHKHSEEEQQEEPQMIAAAKAAIEEVQNEIASLAGEERSSEQLELLVRIACEEHLGNCELSARRMLHGLSGYYLHLSCHRYGSHVTQTVMDICGRFQGQVNNTKDHRNDDDTIVPSVQDLILAAAFELMPHARSLAKHVCGSHVLRAVICALSGVARADEVVTHSPSGNNYINGSSIRKKKHKSQGSNSKNNENRCVQRLKIQFPMSQKCRQGLESLVEAITGYTKEKYIATEATPQGVLPDTKMLALLCHPSSGPLVDLLIRVLTILSSSSEPLQEARNIDFRLGTPADTTKRFLPQSEAEMCIKYILHWNSSNTACGDILYGLSGETHGSRIVETILQVSHDDLYRELLARGVFLGQLGDYAPHDVSNFVVQMILQTARSKDQVEKLVEGLVPLVKNSVLMESSRRGVTFRLVEMCAKWKIGQGEVLNAVLVGCCKKEGVESSSTTSNISPLKVENCINYLLSMQFLEDGGGKLKVDVNGARIIHYLLRFNPKLCGGILDAILSLPSSGLISIAKDGLASRCIMDGILEGPTSKDPFHKALKVLLRKLSGSWTSLALDRVGHHTVIKLYKMCPLEGKLAIASELVKDKNRLSGNAIGRSVSEICSLRQLTEGEDAWRESTTNQLAAEKFLDEIVGATKKKKRKRKKSSHKESSEG